MIGSMTSSSAAKLVVKIMDVEKQSNGSDCGVLAIAYAFDICSGFDPCQLRFDHKTIWQHLSACLERCQFSRFPVCGEQKSAAVKSSKTVDLHCSCCTQVMKWPSVISAMFGITATAWIFPVRCLVMLKFRGNARLVVTVHDC